MPDVTIQVNLEGVDQVSSGFKQMNDESKNLSQSIGNMGKEIRDLARVSDAVGHLGEEFGFLSKEQAKAFNTMGDIFSISGTLVRTFVDLSKASSLLTVAEKARGVAHAFASLMAGGINAIVGVVTAALDAIRNSSLALAIMEMVRATAHTIANAMSGFGIPLVIAGLATAAFAIAVISGMIKIPALAEGGIVTKPTYALIGEREPEVIMPISRLLSVSSRGPTTVNIAINESRTPRETGDAVIDALRRRGLI